MQIPEDLKKLAKQLRSQKLTEERERREKEKVRRLAEEAAREKRLKNGLSYAQFIFKWAEEFRNDEDGKRLIEVSRPTYLNGIIFFDDQLDNKPWRGLGVSLKEVWWIRNGCGAYPVIVRSPKALAAAIDTEILTKACENIKSGKVWDTIRNRWELKNNL